MKSLYHLDFQISYQWKEIEFSDFIYIILQF